MGNKSFEFWYSLNSNLEDRADAICRWESLSREERQHWRKLSRKPCKLKKQFVEYYRYIRSAAWRTKAADLKSKRGKCEICSSANDLQVHHKHYRTLGNERPEDAAVLCSNCHANHHESEGKCLSDSSRDFIELVRNFL